MTNAFQLTGDMRIGLPSAPLAAQLAARDVATDFARVFASPAVLCVTADAPIVARIDAASDATPEGWTIDVTPERLTVRAADTLGLIYGLYAISERFLGVHPMSFWNDRTPEPRDRIDVPVQTLRSKPAAFRYRGWFVNDEDLLTGWRDGGLPRDLDYPYYQTVVHEDVIDRVVEALLRCGGNLVIPASFINILEPSERVLVERAVRRGLYVTQHHIEPLGVSYFSYEKYRRDRGEDQTFSYATQPQRVQEVWRVYAREWARVAGEQVVWQLGLRGRGDRPVWWHDKSIGEGNAGAFISKALAEQMAIIREVDSRPMPPATMTLWDEGSQLMAERKLILPPGTIAVFSDRGASQTMQDDFYDVPREPDRNYGVYYHLAYWDSGPHLAQGVPPEKLQQVFAEILDKGDTAYAIVNVANVRENALGCTGIGQLLLQGREWTADRFYAEQLPETLVPFQRSYFDAIVRLRLGKHEGIVQTQDRHHRTLADGESRKLIRHLIDMHRQGSTALIEHLYPEGCESLSDVANALQRAADAMGRVAHDAQQAVDKLPQRQREGFTFSLCVQARLMHGLYLAAASLVRARNEPAQADNEIGRAIDAIEATPRDLAPAATGQWMHWYRGETKMNLLQLAGAVRSLQPKETDR